MDRPVAIDNEDNDGVIRNVLRNPESSATFLCGPPASCFCLDWLILPLRSRFGKSCVNSLNLFDGPETEQQYHRLLIYSGKRHGIDQDCSGESQCPSRSISRLQDQWVMQ